LIIKLKGKQKSLRNNDAAAALLFSLVTGSAAFSAFPDFLAANENPRVISTVQVPVEIGHVGFGPGRFWGIFHGFDAEGPRTVEKDRIKFEATPTESMQVPDSQYRTGG
jgi:hypothetical protein